MIAGSHNEDDRSRTEDGEVLCLVAGEATGDYAGAKRMLDTLAIVRPEVQKALDRLNEIPTDIEPVFETQ